MSDRPITDALRKLLPQPSEGDPSSTNADLIAAVWLAQILRGDRQSLHDLIARLPRPEAEELAQRVADRLRDPKAPTS